MSNLKELFIKGGPIMWPILVCSIIALTVVIERIIFIVVEKVRRQPRLVDAMLDALWVDGPLDALVNNAAGNFLAKTEELSPRAIDAVLGIVLHGSAYVTVACGRRWLAEKRRASVLSIVTSYAWTGSAYVVPSAMAKAGVLAMTRSLAVEWGGQGVRLNAIAPGPFPTQGAWERLVPPPATAITSLAWVG